MYLISSLWKSPPSHELTIKYCVKKDINAKEYWSKPVTYTSSDKKRFATLVSFIEFAIRNEYSLAPFNQDMLVNISVSGRIPEQKNFKQDFTDFGKFQDFLKEQQLIENKIQFRLHR